MYTPPAPADLDRFAVVNGLRLHYLDWANTSAPPMVLQHGWRAHADVWHEVADHYRQRYRVIAVDSRGHGDSDWDPANRYAVATFADDLEALLEQLDIDQCVLVGHSMGAPVALSVAAHNPHRVRALVMEDGGAAPAGLLDPDGPHVARLTVPAAFAGWAEAEAFQRPLMVDRRLPQEIIRTRWRALFRERSDGCVEWCADVAGLLAEIPGLPESTVLELVTQLRCPTLAMRADLKPTLTPEASLRMQAANPLVEVTVVPGSTHDVHRSQLAAYLAILDGFLKRIA